MVLHGVKYTQTIVRTCNRLIHWKSRGLQLSASYWFKSIHQTAYRLPELYQFIYRFNSPIVGFDIRGKFMRTNPLIFDLSSLRVTVCILTRTGFERSRRLLGALLHATEPSLRDISKSVFFRCAHMFFFFFF